MLVVGWCVAELCVVWCGPCPVFTLRAARLIAIRSCARPVHGSAVQVQVHAMRRKAHLHAWAKLGARTSGAGAAYTVQNNGCGIGVIRPQEVARLPAAGHGVHEARWVVPRGIPEVSTSVEERSGRVGSGAGCSTQVSERPTLVMGSCSCAGEV